MEQLKKHGQTHLIEALTMTNSSKLKQQILGIDLDFIMSLYKKRHHIVDQEVTITPITSKQLSVSERVALYDRGLEIIKSSKAAVVLMAGGQGTRLGHQGPKGTFDIGLDSHKSLFELHTEALIDLYHQTNTFIPWYIMTSEDNHKETVAFFKKHNFFNYKPDSITFFKQDQLPLQLEDGKLALINETSLNLAANGNGGVFTSLKSNMLIEDMRSKGVEQVFICGVDNALAKLADPVFLAFAKETDKDVSSKAIDKVDAYEKVGVMCYKDNKPTIVEYSELSDDLRHEKDETGQLIYRHANILAHILKLDFIEKCANMTLPYHVAHKKVDYYDGGKLITANEPNGYKYELFIFDVFEYADDMSVLTVDRSTEFAPVKNASGNDSPETARLLYKNLKSQGR